MEIRDITRQVPTHTLQPVERASVTIIPFVAEHSSQLISPGPRANPPRSVQEVRDTICHTLWLQGVKCKINMLAAPAGQAEYQNADFWGSHAEVFLRDVAPRLAPVAIVVSHGNFMRQSLCGTDRCPQVLGNGNILQVQNGEQTIYVVRHCTTCHNLTGEGSVDMTMCHDLDALRQAQFLTRSLLAKHGREHVGVYCSAMPRAITTAMALQAEIGHALDLLSLQFGACQYSNQLKRVA